MSKVYGTPGPRSIYPDIARSRSLRRCGLLANAMFPRLIPQADDQGRGKGDAVDIATDTGVLLIRGVTLEAAEAAVRELVVEGMVRLYEVGGEPYWQLVGWWEWQGPAQRRAYPSRHPAPEGWGDAVYGDGDGQPTTWRAALGLPPGQPGPRSAREQSQEPAPGTVPGTDPGTVRTSLAVPSPSQAGAAPSRAPAEPSRAGPREAPAAGDPGGPPPARPTNGAATTACPNCGGEVDDRPDRAVVVGGSLRHRVCPADQAPTPTETGWLA